MELNEAVLIDTHTHVVSPDDVRYPRHDMALANGAWWDDTDCSFGAMRNQVGDAAVSKVVLVQAAGAYRADNGYLLDALRDGGDRFIGIVIVDPADPGAADELRRLAEHRGVVGVRLFHIPTPAQSWLDDERGDAAVDASAELGLAVTVTGQHWDLPLLAHQLERRRDVDFIIDHCFFPDFSGGAPYPHAEPLWMMADHPNLHVKFTPTCAHISLEDSAEGPAADPDGSDDPADMLEHVVARFGAERVVLGTDWPQHRGAATYAEQVAMIVGWTEGFTESDRAMITSENARRLFFARA